MPKATPLLRPWSCCVISRSRPPRPSATSASQAALEVDTESTKTCLVSFALV